jgi:hypothetical protein
MSFRSAITLVAVVAACSEVGPRGYLSGTWTGFEVATDIRFTIERARLVSIFIIPNPPSGFNWYCSGLTSANGISAAVDIPIVNDSVHVVLPAGNWTATVDGKFYQVSGYLELRAGITLSGPACAGAVFNPVAFSARHIGE